MRYSIASITGGLALAALLLGGGTARAVASDNTLPYRIAYKNTQSIFDQCGDVARGGLFRKVVREKVDRCPVFGEAEKAEFRTWAAARDAEYSEPDNQAAAPDVIGRCKAFAATAEYRTLRLRIDRYGRGDGGADDVIQEACQPAER